MKVRIQLAPDSTPDDIVELMEMNITPSENYLEFNTGGGLDYLPEDSRAQTEQFLTEVLTSFGKLLMQGLYLDVAWMFTSKLSPGKATISEAIEYAKRQIQIIIAMEEEATS